MKYLSITVTPCWAVLFPDIFSTAAWLVQRPSHQHSSWHIKTGEITFWSHSTSHTLSVIWTSHKVIWRSIFYLLLVYGIFKVTHLHIDTWDVMIYVPLVSGNHRLCGFRPQPVLISLRRLIISPLNFLLSGPDSDPVAPKRFHVFLDLIIQVFQMKQLNMVCVVALCTHT